ncbi:MAG: 3-methyl-2-oxobutanoate hydroxymethyltransferase [Methylococcaceae bacterium]
MFDPSRSLTISALQAMKSRNEKITALTAYDFSFGRILDEAGVDVVLVGDSLGMVVQGHETTLPVTVEDMIYHTLAVTRGVRRAMVIVDMPYMSYSHREQALSTAASLIRAGGQMVKLEGGTGTRIDVIRALVDQNVPVCGHLGLLPQSVYRMGGFVMQGRNAVAAQELFNEAMSLQEVGISLLILEGMPAELASEITQALTIPTLGIGAGPGCNGQILVLYDLLGITPGKKLRFAKNYLAESGSVSAAVNRYVDEVRSGLFPEAIHWI